MTIRFVKHWLKMSIVSQGDGRESFLFRKVFWYKVHDKHKATSSENIIFQDDEIVLQNWIFWSIFILNQSINPVQKQSSVQTNLSGPSLDTWQHHVLLKFNYSVNFGPPATTDHNKGTNNYKTGKLICDIK